jgi:hypothetical protein
VPFVREMIWAEVGKALLTLFLQNNGKLGMEIIAYVIWYRDGMITIQHSDSASLSA